MLDIGEVTVLSMNYSGGLGNLSFNQSEIVVTSFDWDITDLGTLTNPSSGFDFFATPASGTGIGMEWVTGVNLGFVNDGSGPAGSMYLFDAATFVPSAQLDATAVATVSVPVAPVPEPESYLMMALGLAGIAAAKRRKLV
jgi:hypothetical protein